MSDSVWPHRQQPTRLPRPWDSPGKNTGVGCHFLLQCMKVKSESEVAQVVFDPQRPHGLQPTRSLHPWDFPGRSTGVECHCLLRDTSIKIDYMRQWNAIMILDINPQTQLTNHWQRRKEHAHRAVSSTTSVGWISNQQGEGKRGRKEGREEGRKTDPFFVCVYIIHIRTPWKYERAKGRTLNERWTP